MVEAIKLDNSNNITVNVLRSILYFDVFNYPLTLDEVHSFSEFSKQEVTNVLMDLQERNILHKIANFYSLTNDVNIAKRRKEGNVYAKQIMGKANKMATLISRFPFVEFVSISGSLSKGYFEKLDDIDYFIITKPNRLWLSKTLLIAFKKVFLLNSKKHFCINYFISSNALELAEKNLFTAVEFKTLLSLLEKDNLLERFKKENKWVNDYFPNYEMNEKVNPIKNYKTKRFLEFLLNGFIGDYLEKLSKDITKSFQQRKYKKLQSKDFNIAFKGNETVSKHHPDNNQKKVITLLNEKIEIFNEKFSMNIPLE